jgi:hypothetical protein
LGYHQYPLKRLVIKEYQEVDGATIHAALITVKAQAHILSNGIILLAKLRQQSHLWFDYHTSLSCHICDCSPPCRANTSWLTKKYTKTDEDDNQTPSMITFCNICMVGTPDPSDHTQRYKAIQQINLSSSDDKIPSTQFRLFFKD